MLPSLPLSAPALFSYCFTFACAVIKVSISQDSQTILQAPRDRVRDDNRLEYPGRASWKRGLQPSLKE